ncbi:hypothetical protein GN325_20750 [Agrobacterium vitis]|uniref:hypothetical protein n=1 Tax=Agrobacterium vitis TaxID=373 RepID=UPI0012E90421|nr:hypothetical protein [Agrobacterium vitis]MVB04197.1 hypothetical protein [Agrobacterium vitis]NSY10799.1 hypothetical protein [Agrobacterium vitis]
MSNNPSVNRCLKDKAFDHIDHALGRPVDPMRESHRNYYATDAESDLAKAFGASENWKLASSTKSGMAYFHVTDAGRIALRNHLACHSVNMGRPWRAFAVEFNGYSDTIPARSRGQAKYLRFLSVSDCYPSLKFGEFVKRANVRVAS